MLIVIVCELIHPHIFLLFFFCPKLWLHCNNKRKKNTRKKHGRKKIFKTTCKSNWPLCNSVPCPLRHRPSSLTPSYGSLCSAETSRASLLLPHHHRLGNTDIYYCSPLIFLVCGVPSPCFLFGTSWSTVIITKAFFPHRVYDCLPLPLLLPQSAAPRCNLLASKLYLLHLPLHSLWRVLTEFSQQSVTHLATSVKCVFEEG